MTKKKKVEPVDEEVTPALIALRRAAAKALNEAIALDRPFHVWEDGKIVNIGGGQKRNRKPRPKA